MKKIKLLNFLIIMSLLVAILIVLMYSFSQTYFRRTEQNIENLWMANDASTLSLQVKYIQNGTNRDYLNKIREVDEKLQNIEGYNGWNSTFGVKRKAFVDIKSVAEKSDNANYLTPEVLEKMPDGALNAVFFDDYYDSSNYTLVEGRFFNKIDLNTNEVEIVLGGKNFSKYDGLIKFEVFVYSNKMPTKYVVNAKIVGKIKNENDIILAPAIDVLIKNAFEINSGANVFEQIRLANDINLNFKNGLTKQNITKINNAIMDSGVYYEMSTLNTCESFLAYYDNCKIIWFVMAIFLVVLFEILIILLLQKLQFNYSTLLLYLTTCGINIIIGLIAKITIIALIYAVILIVRIAMVIEWKRSISKGDITND